MYFYHDFVAGGCFCVLLILLASLNPYTSIFKYICFKMIENQFLSTARIPSFCHFSDIILLYLRVFGMEIFFSGKNALHFQWKMYIFVRIKYPNFSRFNLLVRHGFFKGYSRPNAPTYCIKFMSLIYNRSQTQTQKLPYVF